MAQRVVVACRITPLLAFALTPLPAHAQPTQAAAPPGPTLPPEPAPGDERVMAAEQETPRPLVPPPAEQAVRSSPPPLPSARELLPEGSATRLAAEEGPAGTEPQLSWGAPMLCAPAAPGMTLHAQCDPDRRLCLFHHGCAPGTDGPRCVALDRLADCTHFGMMEGFRAQLEQAGFRFVRARAEAPPGWVRDEQGRVFQTEFDMNRRLWLGASWRPAYGPGDRYELGRVGFDLGLRAEWLSSDTRTRHRLHLLEGELCLNPLSAKGRLVRYDGSEESDTPLVRLTTFWPPARHDLYASVGWFLDGLGFEVRPRGARHETMLRVGAVGPTLDLWHGLDLSDYLRLRVGAAFDDLLWLEDGVTHRLALTPLAALETDVLVDDAGLHRITAGTSFELPLVWSGDESSPVPTVRFLSEAAYEIVLVAINDQPLSLRAAVGGGYRSDLQSPYAGWELEGNAGLRFSFWAPGPDADDARRIAQKRGP